MSPRSITLFSLASLLVLALGTASAFAKKEPIEKYQANIFAMGATVGDKSSVIHINLYKWSSDEDREEVLNAIEEAAENRRAYSAVPDALRRLGKAGYMFLAGGQGWPIRYARVVERGGKREIFLAIDRPVTFSEIYRGSAVRNFDITLIVLDFEDSAMGEGVVSVGSNVKWNEVENQFEITSYSSQPVRLGDVRPVE